MAKTFAFHRDDDRHSPNARKYSVMWRFEPGFGIVTVVDVTETIGTVTETMGIVCVTMGIVRETLPIVSEPVSIADKETIRVSTPVLTTTGT